jgi:hypothetical protein
VNPFGEAINLLANTSHFVANPHTSLLMLQTSLLMPQLSKNLSQSPPKNPPRPSKKKSPKPIELYGQEFKNVGFVEFGGRPSVRGEGR